MQDIFNVVDVIHYGLIRSPEWRYVQDGLQASIANLKAYYASRIYAVRSNHPLAVLLNSLSLSLTSDTGNFYNDYYFRAEDIGKTYNFTSTTNRGRIYRGTFFGGNNPEVIMAINDTGSPYSIEQNWKTTATVKVLSHNKTDINLALPNGKKTTVEDGVTIITVDIPALILQYRCFQKANQIKGDNLSAAHFIHMYVLPNMLASYLDLSLVNRFYALLIGAPINRFANLHALSLIDYNRRVDDCQQHLIDVLRNKKYYYNKILESIPGVTQLNFKEILRLPEDPATYQVEWAYCIARLDAVSMLLELGYDKTEDLNQQTLNHVRRELMSLKNSAAITNFLPSDVAFDYNYRIDELIERLK